MLITQEANNTYDKLLASLNLIHMVNYKKLKSIKKRLLVPNYIFFRKFLLTLKINLGINVNRKYVQLNPNQNLFTAGFLLHKRMYLKNVSFLNYLESKKSDYF
jgi:hypothetical protein